MADHPKMERLECLLTETLGDEERVYLETHIEGCSLCQQTLHDLTLGAAGPSTSALLLAGTPRTADDDDGQAQAFFDSLKRMRPVDSEGPAPTNASGSAEPVHLEGYEILEELGRGAAGVVYRARHIKLNRLVALKLIVAGPHMSPEVRQRFQAEARATARLQHANIVRIYDVGEQAGFPYLSLELVEGGNLSDWLSRKPRPPREAAQIIAKLAEAIDYAHHQGVLHRDLKPGNVLLRIVPDRPQARELKITDFGIAKVLPQGGTLATSMTQTGEILGTPAYMSPEQARGDAREIGPATDIYSLGAMLYELLTGRPPFQGATAIDTLMQAAWHEPVSITLLVPRVPRDLNTICLKCLEKNVGRRYPTAEALAADLGRYLRDEPIRARPLSLLGHGVRWARRHRGVAASLSALALSLALLAVVSLAATVHFRSLERAQRTLAREKGNLADEKEAQRAKAVIAQKAAETNRQLAEKNQQLADKHRQRAENKGREVLQNLYFDRMNLGGNAATTPGAIGRLCEFLEPWSHEEVDFRNWEWYYLDSLCHRDLYTMSGHTQGVLSVAWSPDGRRVASGSFDGTVRIWDANVGRQIRSISGHTAEVNSVAWSPDGRRLAAATGMGVVKICNPESGEELLSFRNGDQTMFAAAWSPDGRLIASGGRDHTIRIWDPRTGNLQTAFDSGNTRPIRDLAWSPNGKRLASGDENGDVQLWDPLAGKNLRRTHGHANMVSRVAWSPDGTRLASSSTDSTVKIWDADSGAERITLQGHTRGVVSVAWSPDGARVATAGEDQSLRVWRVADGAELFALRGHTAMMTSVAWSPDGKRLVSAAWDATVKIWNADAGPEVPVLPGHSGFVTGVDWAPDGNHLASSGSDGSIRIWDTLGRKEEVSIQGHTDWVSSIAWSKDGRRLASTGFDHAIKIWNASNGHVLTSIPVDAKFSNCIAWSPDGSLLASGDSGFRIHIWDSASGRETQTFIGHENEVQSVAWSPDGKHLASGSSDRTVRIWDATTGEQLSSVAAHRATVKSVAWSPDGRRLASASDDQTIMIWDTTTHQVLVTLRGHTSDVASAVWSHDGTRLASVSGDRTVKIWDSVTGRETLTFNFDRLMKTVAWSPFETALAVGGDDHVIRLYDAAPSYLSARAPQYLQQLDRRLSANPKNAADWRLRTEIDSRRVDWTEATTDATHYLSLDAAQHWLTMGYWVVGPYPQTLDTSYSPEKDHDPGHAAVGAGGADWPEFLGWRTAPLTESGFLDLGVMFEHAPHISVYAMLKIYSPTEQRVAILAGSDDQVRLWLNGKQIHESLKERPAIADEDAVAAVLAPGWNTLLARVTNFTGDHALFLRLSDAQSDLKRAGAEPSAKGR